MASLREKVEAELEQMDRALRELPGARRVWLLQEGDDPVCEAAGDKKKAERRNGERETGYVKRET